MYIERLNNIESIIGLQNDFYKKHGIAPVNVSNWTVSKEFRDVMEHCFRHSNDISPIDYLYSYNISSDLRDSVMETLGVEKSVLTRKTCIFFPNNSLSIINVCNLLQKMKKKNVGILYPAYFSIESCMNTYGITYTSIYIKRNNGTYIIPLDEIQNKCLDAIWITSPIYSTGTCYSEKELMKIESLLKSGILVIADESFCVNGHELIRKYAKYENFIGIYSPHKAISFNSYKFSVIVCEDTYEDMFEQWLDVFCGNLPQTTIAAIYHYLSDNYLQCHQNFDRFITNSLSEVRTILLSYANVETDDIVYGNLITLFMKNINYNVAKDLSFMQDIITNTHALFYPGYLNGFSEAMGFCFRINLALYSPEFIAGLRRLLQYLDKF